MKQQPKIDFDYLAENLDTIQEENLLFEMANFRPKITGLPMVIWVVPDAIKKHGPRIKVQQHHGEKISDKNDWASVTIENQPKVVTGNLTTSDFNLVEAFIKKYKKILLGIWNDVLEPSDLTIELLREKEISFLPKKILKRRKG